jgi:hypothetical protein
VIDVLPSTLAEMLRSGDIEGLESLILASNWFNELTNTIPAQNFTEWRSRVRIIKRISGPSKSGNQTQVRLSFG